jgi:hypothetical protein
MALRHEAPDKMGITSYPFPIRTTAIGLLILLLIFPGVIYSQSSPVIEVGKFSAENPGDDLPPGWKPLIFKKIKTHTLYQLVGDGDTTVMKAVSNASASGLIREITINPKEYPIIQWRWKVENILAKGDVHRKEGDDYPARVYIAFEYDASKLSLFERAKYQMAKLLYGQYPPLGAINYIWESKAPVNTIVSNPFTSRVKMIVVESGGEKLNQWVNEERNVYEDYIKAFGEEPPLISGVAIMTDTDNTGESATAYYGDIRFLKGMTGGAPHP